MQTDHLEIARNIYANCIYPTWTEVRTAHNHAYNQLAKKVPLDHHLTRLKLKFHPTPFQFKRYCII